MTSWLVVAALLAVDPAGGTVAPGPEVRYLKGQLHLHSNRSGDSDTPPDDVVRWYAAHGYDFIVFTDHNRITTRPSTPSMLVIPGVELTQNSNRCVPAPPPGRKCLLHVNALFVTPPALGLIPWGLPASSSRTEIYRPPGPPPGGPAGCLEPHRDLSAGGRRRPSHGRPGPAQSPQLPPRRRRPTGRRAGA